MNIYTGEKTSEAVCTSTRAWAVVSQNTSIYNVSSVEMIFYELIELYVG